MEVIQIKKESLLTENEINEMLLQAPVGYLALSKDDRPYVLPLNYLFCDGEVFFHCAPKGRKIDYIKANPRVCFHVGETGGLIRGENPCSYNYKYHSVIVEGTVVEICGNVAKEVILRKIVAKYADPGVSETPISTQRVEQVGVYRLIPEQISGKKNS